MKKYDKLILVILLVVFGVGIAMTVRSAFEPYVTFTHAQNSQRSAQVRGIAVDGTLQIIDESSFSFEMEDLEGTILRVYRNGNIPSNLFDAEYIVVRGKVESGEHFNANEILVKCPSKYEAQDS